MQGRIVVAVMVCLELLAGCGGGKEQAAGSTPSASPAAPVDAGVSRDSPAPKKPVEPTIPVAALPDTAAVVMDVRLEGKVSAGGRDSGKAVALRVAGFTIEAVFTPEDGQGPWAAIATSEYEDSGFAVQQYSDRNNQYYIGIAGKRGGIVSTPVAVAPALTYLVFSLSDGMLRTYVNGAQKAVDAVPPGFEIRNSNLTVHIGNSRLVARPFTGSIHQVRISDRAMPAAEVAEKWAALSKSVAEAKKGP